jgi:hypothetical protein
MDLITESDSFLFSVSYLSVIQTKSDSEDVVGCILIGERIGDLAGTRASLLRAIPYVGIAVGVISAGSCIYGMYN